MKTKILFLMMFCTTTFFTSQAQVQLWGSSYVSTETTSTMYIQLNAGLTYPITISYYWTLAGQENWFNIIDGGSLTMQNSNDSIAMSGLNPGTAYTLHLQEGSTIFADRDFETLPALGITETQISPITAWPIGNKKVCIKSGQDFLDVPLTINNLIGQTVSETKLAESIQTIDLAGNPPGLYLVSARIGTSRITTKILLD